MYERLTTEVGQDNKKLKEQPMWLQLDPSLVLTSKVTAGNTFYLKQ